MTNLTEDHRTQDELLALLHVPTEHELLRWAFDQNSPPAQLITLKWQIKSWPKDFCKANSALWCIPVEVQKMLHQEIEGWHPSEKPSHLDELTLQLYMSMANQLTPASLSRLASWYVWLRDPLLHRILEVSPHELLVAADYVAKTHPDRPMWELRKPISDYPELAKRVPADVLPRLLFSRLLGEHR